jgi:hypothetical protein
MPALMDVVFRRRRLHSRVGHPLVEGANRRPALGPDSGVEVENTLVGLEFGMVSTIAC